MLTARDTFNRGGVCSSSGRVQAHCSIALPRVVVSAQSLQYSCSIITLAPPHPFSRGQRPSALLQATTTKQSHHMAEATGVAGGLAESQPQQQQEYCVVNFYHLVDIENPQQLVEQHRQWVERHGLDIQGRIYWSSQGVNAQYGGVKKDAVAYVEWLLSQPLFQGLRHTVWPASGHMYPKLRLKYKPSLISLAGGMAALPITDPSARATPLKPAEWKSMLAEAKARDIVVLDVRNDYEWDAGHFEGAARPAEEVFHETPVGGGEGGEGIPQPLLGRDKDAPVMMYCTGGIRCDVYSTFLRKAGFNRLYTLEGGIQGYFLQERDALWKGSLYVFDGRMAISAKEPTASVDMPAPAPTTTACTDRPISLPAAVPCQICGAPDPQLPHVNCANVDCNEQFIACDACKAQYHGCCCAECMQAPRLLRPAKLEGGNYGQWGNYADEQVAGKVMATGRQREGRLARRARRRSNSAERRMQRQQEEAMANSGSAVQRAAGDASPELQRIKDLLLTKKASAGSGAASPPKPQVTAATAAAASASQQA